MSQYTTGEMAKACGVTVRTVQYYDTRGLLVPSELSEGGRRLYSEEDVRRLKVICFLRELGISISTIDQLLKEADPGSVIELRAWMYRKAEPSEAGIFWTRVVGIVGAFVGLILLILCFGGSV